MQKVQKCKLGSWTLVWHSTVDFTEVGWRGQCIRKDKGLLRFPFLCRSTKARSQLKASSWQTRIANKTIRMEYFTSKHFGRGCIDTKPLSRVKPFLLIDRTWKQHDFTSQDHLHTTSRSKKASAVQFSLLSALAALFCDPPLTRVSKATCGQTGDAKSSEN